MSRNIFTSIVIGMLFFAPIFLYADEEKEKYLPCTTGPQMLRQIDTWERNGIAANIHGESGQKISSETLAEKLIADCSEQLTLVSAAAGIGQDPSFKAVANAWQTGLDFMKWWLQNRRSKQLPKIKLAPK